MFTWLRFHFRCFVVALTLAGSVNAALLSLQDGCCSPTTEATLKKCALLDFETGHYGGYVSQSLIRCCQIQDTWIFYLNNVEGSEEYHRGMKLLYEHANSYRNMCRYAAEIVNFFNPGQVRFLVSQPVVHFPYDTDVVQSFYNTFKQGRSLTAKEREEFFQEEMDHYCRDSLVAPFILDKTTLSTVKPETVYNFALLSDGTIRVAREKPGRRQYYYLGQETTDPLFTHPNHTVLAGGPHEPLLTAGSFLFYEKEGRRLYFISNKSGHYVPYYSTLERMREAMEKIGVNKYTVIATPDTDIAKTVLKLYHAVQVPVSLRDKDISRLFSIAYKRWIETLDTIDSGLLKALSEGDLSVLDSNSVDKLISQRNEATYIRCAYQLFSIEHKAPDIFHDFVKRFGKLKDAIRHSAKGKIQSEAKDLVKIMKSHHDILRNHQIVPCTFNSLSNYLSHKVENTKSLLKNDTLPAEKYHDIKKMSRELGVLFTLLTDGFQYSDGYSLNRAAAADFFRTNDLMTESHDLCIQQVICDGADYGQMTIKLNENITERFNRQFRSLRIIPPSFSLTIPEDHCWKLINCAKWWCIQHAGISRYPKARSKDNDNPHARLLLEKIVKGDFNGLESEEERDGYRRLLFTLHFAEKARTAMIFLDQSHTVEQSVDVYIDSLQKVVDLIEYGIKEDSKDAAIQMLHFFEDRAIPTRGLENIEYTNQIGFNSILQGCLTRIGLLTSGNPLTLKNAKEALRKVGMLCDMLDLFRFAGVRYQSLPLACYDLSFEASSKLKALMEEALFPLIKKDSHLIDENALIPVTEAMIEEANYLIGNIEC